MKTIFLSIICSFFCYVSFGQIYVGHVDITRLDSLRVIEVVIDRRGSGKTIDVFVDYGQKDNTNSLGMITRSDNVMMKDPRTQEKVIFKSTAAAINFFEQNGWMHYNTIMDRSISDVGYYYFRKSPVHND